MTIDIHLLHYTVPVEIPAVWATFLQEEHALWVCTPIRKTPQVFFHSPTDVQQKNCPHPNNLQISRVRDWIPRKDHSQETTTSASF